MNEKQKVNLRKYLDLGRAAVARARRESELPPIEAEDNRARDFRMFFGATLSLKELQRGLVFYKRKLLKRDWSFGDEGQLRLWISEYEQLIFQKMNQ